MNFVFVFSVMVFVSATRRKSNFDCTARVVSASCRHPALDNSFIHEKVST